MEYLFPAAYGKAPKLPRTWIAPLVELCLFVRHHFVRTPHAAQTHNFGRFLPCYNEERNVADCYKAVKKLFEGPLAGYDWEHVFSDNCSKDGTVEVLRGIAAKDPHVKVIVNARNFGAFRSMYNALLKTSGDGVVVMLAVDLQDPPELIKEFVAKWEEGYKVVYGIRKNRKESLLMRAARSLFYRMVAFSANVAIPVDAGEFQLIDRQVVEALRTQKDYYPYVRGMIANAGFKSVGIPYNQACADTGNPARIFFTSMTTPSTA